MRAIWISCLAVALIGFKITPTDPVEMPVLDVNSLAAVAPPDAALAGNEPKQPTAQPPSAESSTTGQSAATPSAAPQSAPEPAKPDEKNVADAGPAQAPVAVTAAKADGPENKDPKSDAAKPDAAKSDAVAHAKPDTDKKSDQTESDEDEKSAPTRTKHRSSHRIRAASDDTAGQKRIRPRAKMHAEARVRDEEALKNANANANMAEQPAEPSCTDSNSLLRAFNLSPPCR